MLQAAYNALSQMLSPPFRVVLFKSVGACAPAGGADRVRSVRAAELARRRRPHLDGGGDRPSRRTARSRCSDGSSRSRSGSACSSARSFSCPRSPLWWRASSPTTSPAEVERTHYPSDPPGVPVPLGYALIEAIKTALLAIAIYLCCLPFLLVAGLGAVIFFLATAYLLGREYFLIAALRLHPIHTAKALWRARRWEIFSAGLLIAAFVLIPIVNLATPLFATAFMVHVNKRLAATPRRLVEPHA